jgi:predicted DNA-binding mobile mystery protein A
MNTAAARKALDKSLGRLRPAGDFRPPHRGWVRAIRDALGMTADQLAQRMKITQPSVAALEKAESKGTITLARLERAAEALGCTLVYALVPHRPLNETVLDRARLCIDKELSRVDRTMALEAQNLGAAELADEREDLAADLLRNHIRRLWDEA